MIKQFDRLVGAVQRNCHIADARHAREMTLCTYLLEMREFYRWEAGIPLGDPLARPEVGSWLNEREALWETLADNEFATLPLGDGEYEPFDVAAINRQIVPHQLVYGAGIGRFGKPHFFLGRLERREESDGLTILVCECEYARDLTAIPAALQGGTVIVRREALRQWLWEKAEAWAMKKTPGALALALAAHGYETDPRGALERMTAAETETLILHERGEHAAGRRLGPQWEEMIVGFKKRRPEILARAVRDNLADCLVTLPTLIEQAAWPQLWFWFANFDGMRRELFPALAACDFAKVGSGETAALLEIAQRGAEHWHAVASDFLDRYRTDATEAEVVLEKLSHDPTGIRQ
ncbi:MAG: hypothetical protein Q8L56_15455 [Rhodocyclaceae bacterium]|nr:hypothetical protein [Rhodocyclaceae bacterium]